MYQHPINAGNYWTEEEDANLKQRCSYGTSMRDLADLHGRSILGIEWRLAKIAAEELLNDDPEEILQSELVAAAVKYRVPESSIIKWLDSMKPQAYKDNLRAQITTIKCNMKRTRDDNIKMQDTVKELSDRLSRLEDKLTFI